VVADEVMVMTGSVPDGLVADHPLADLDALHEPDLLELVHHAIDARARDLALALEQRLLDLDSGERAGLLVEQLEDRPPRATAAVAGIDQRTRRLGGPRRPI
jgi:hypothetical protein